MNSMLEKLHDIKKEYDRLALQLADPEVIRNQEKYTSLNKKYSGLSGIIRFYDRWIHITYEIDGAKEILANEDDSELRDMARSEIRDLESEINSIKGEIKKLLSPPDPYDHKNAVLEIRAGTGGAEAGLFAADLFRMYSRYAESNNWKIEILSQSLGGLEGYKEIIALISGSSVFKKLKYESGVHRVQRVPVTETNGRIHTSAVTVALLPEAEDVEVDLDPSEIKIDYYRSSGPGGQSVNTTDSAVRITHIKTRLVVTCQDEKSQHKNKSKAMKILKSRLLDKMRQEQEEKIAKERRQMVSSGDRSAKIRTYNFPQNRVSDHRMNLTLHKLEYILQGNMDELLSGIQEYFQTEKLKSQTSESLTQNK